MKKIFLFILTASIAVTSCNKEDVSELQPEQINNTFVFTSAKPTIEDGSGTKTEWSGHTIQWSKEDQMRMAYTVDGVWQGASDSNTSPKLYASNKLAAATDVARFTINTSFTSTATGTHIFYGFYPGTLVGGTDFSNAPYATITIPSTQTPKANSFDAAADVMIGVSAELPSKPSSTEEILMKWTRKVAHAVLTLTNLSISSGETIQNGNNTSDNWDLFQDTPQGGLTGIEELEYLTEATKRTVNANVVNDTTESETATGTESSSENTMNNITTTDSYLEHVYGKQGAGNYSKMLMEYRQTFINIDTKIIDDLKDLFFNLW